MIFGVRLVFLFIFLPSGIIKKNAEPTMGRTWPGLPGRGLYKALPRGPRAQPPQPPNPSALAAAPPPAVAASRRRPAASRRRQPPSPRRRSAGAARRPRFAALEIRAVLKKNLFVVFFFRQIFRGYFLIAISDPIFVLV